MNTTTWITMAVMLTKYAVFLFVDWDQWIEGGTTTQVQICVGAWLDLHGVTVVKGWTRVIMEVMLANDVL